MSCVWWFCHSLDIVSLKSFTLNKRTFAFLAAFFNLVVTSSQYHSARVVLSGWQLLLRLWSLLLLLDSFFSNSIVKTCSVLKFSHWVSVDSSPFLFSVLFFVYRIQYIILLLFFSRCVRLPVLLCNFVRVKYCFRVEWIRFKVIQQENIGQWNFYWKIDLITDIQRTLSCEWMDGWDGWWVVFALGSKVIDRVTSMWV